MSNAGRPPAYKTAKELQVKIDEFFEECKKQDEYITITGLVLHCGFADRASFYDYEKKPEFTHTIKASRTKIEQDYEKSLRKNGRAGDIFGLKNFGWSDKTEIDQSITFPNAIDISFTEPTEKNPSDIPKD